MVAYHFPPLAGSSGIQRTLRFVQHLPDLGWQPLLLTVQAHAYERTSDDLLPDLPSDLVIRRAFALDTSRHLTVFGRYLGVMARPDRWMTWRYDAIRQGLRLIREFKPDVIWSTYPIATAHLIGSALHQRSGLPWVADFRDPMAQDGYPADPLIWESYRAIEADAAARAAYCVFTTPGAAREYQQRYPAAAERMVVLENGYDEESFIAAAKALVPTAVKPSADQPLVMLHSGIVYPSERDPTQLFMALAKLQKSGVLSPANLQIRFRAAVHEAMLMQLAKTHEVEAFIDVCPAIPYREALAEMMSVDGLLIMQASNCNAQIPAKIYEYLRAGKPIVGLTDPDGDTAGVLRSAGLLDIARLDSVDEIAELLPRIVSSWRADERRLPDTDAVAKASRRGRSTDFADLLSEVTIKGRVG